MLLGSSTHPHRLVSAPCMSPKNTAITVELMIITLYGIEKSGVGRSISSLRVYTCRLPVLSTASPSP